MKTKTILMSVLALAALASCNKAKAPGQDAAENGTDTYIGMVVELPAGAMSKAADTNASESECKLNTLSIYHWVPGGTFNAPTKITISSENLEAVVGQPNTYRVKTPIPVKTGKNNIFVAANYITDFTSEDQLVNQEKAATVSTAGLSTANSFAMFSDKITLMPNVKSATAAEAGDAAFNVPENKLNVILRRAVAKVAVKSGIADVATTFPDAGNVGKYSNLKWTLFNVSNKLVPATPYIDKEGQFVPSNVLSRYDSWETEAAATPIVAAGSFRYCTENSHGTDKYMEGNSTAIKLVANFLPNQYFATTADVVAIAPDGTIQGTQSSTGLDGTKTFYVLQRDKSFFTLEAANKYLSLYQAKYNKPATTLKQLFTAYTDGLCYFRVDLWNTATSTDKNKSWGVLRNHIYSVNIKSIKGPGRPAFPIDPNTPLDEESWIQVTVDVEPWVFNDLGDVDLQ